MKRKDEINSWYLSWSLGMIQPDWVYMYHFTNTEEKDETPAKLSNPQPPTIRFHARNE